MKNDFRRAAMLMDSSRSPSFVDGACVALENCGAGHLKALFTRMFDPTNGENRFYWMGPPQSHFGKESAEDRKNRSTRVFALLLAGEAWEDFS